jgi:hypothetical protein
MQHLTTPRFLTTPPRLQSIAQLMLPRATTPKPRSITLPRATPQKLLSATRLRMPLLFSTPRLLCTTTRRHLSTILQSMMLQTITLRFPSTTLLPATTPRFQLTTSRPPSSFFSQPLYQVSSFYRSARTLHRSAQVLTLPRATQP